MKKTFKQLYREGATTLSEIENYIEAWHLSDLEKPLPEYLGLTEKEYSDYVHGRPDFISK